MLAQLAKCIDWTALQLAYAVAFRAAAPQSRWKLQEALDFLNGPDFLPPTSDPAQLTFNGPRHFQFPTPRPGQHPENNIVPGRLFRCTDRWHERPVILLLDGNPSVGYHTGLPWLARRLNRAGFNAATPVAPFNLHRRPRRSIEWNCLALAQLLAQNVAEIRALTGWLLQQNCPTVGLLGFSFGAWIAGLTASTDPRIAAAILTVPAVRMTRSTPPLFWRRTFRSLKPAHEALDTTRLSLLNSTPVIPKENILLVEAIHDLFAESQPIEQLWRHWRQPDIWRLPAGHVTWPFTPGLINRTIHWLKPRLNQAESPTPPTPE